MILNVLFIVNVLSDGDDFLCNKTKPTKSLYEFSLVSGHTMVPYLFQTEIINKISLINTKNISISSMRAHND